MCHKMPATIWTLCKSQHFSIKKTNQSPGTSQRQYGIIRRSTTDLLKIIERLEEREATLVILDMNLDTSSPTGRLLVSIVGSIAQFEREIMLQRQREGITAARAAGKYKGRQPTARSKSDEVISLYNQGMGAAEIAKQLNISRASTYRIIASHTKQAA